MAGEVTLTIEGNLVGDAELRFTPSGSAVANFTIASTPRTFDRQSNEWKDGETLFMRCSAWKDLAENIAETLRKGMAVIAVGRLKSRTYETKEGEKRTVQEMEVDNVGPSLKWATATVQRTQRNGNQGQRGGNQNSNRGGNSQGYQGGQQGGGYVQQDDPWATPGVSNSGAWGSGPDSEPPF